MTVSTKGGATAPATIEPGRPAVPAFSERRIAVLVPCYNEEVAIAEVVAGFRQALPGAIVHVYDNNSKDRTVEAAREAGATVGTEPRQGKGHVVRRMFADIDADIYIMADGDATYHAPSAPGMIEKLIAENLDMVVGTRVDSEAAAYRRGHRSGNALFTWFVAGMFGSAFTDILSGYRAFSRRFVKSFPALSGGFEIETELTIHALELGEALPQPGGLRVQHAEPRQVEARRGRLHEDAQRLRDCAPVRVQHQQPQETHHDRRQCERHEIGGLQEREAAPLAGQQYGQGQANRALDGESDCEKYGVVAEGVPEALVVGPAVQDGHEVVETDELLAQ